MNDLLKRMRATISMDAINGDAFERNVAGEQFKESADYIAKLEAELGAEQRLHKDHVYITFAEYDELIKTKKERDRLRDAIRRSLRLLSYGGDAEVMAILERALEEK